MLNPEHLYYLSHPFTTHGNKKRNQIQAKLYQVYLTLMYGIVLINPICMPLGGEDNEKAMNNCQHLYRACDAVIFCGKWDKSTGCKEEHAWAKVDKKPIYYLRSGLLHKVQ